MWCDVARCTWHPSEPDTRLWEAGADSWVAMGRQEAEALQQPNMLECKFLLVAFSARLFEILYGMIPFLGDFQTLLNSIKVSWREWK